ncbi:MAG TPA: ATP-dependent helicase [Tepidimicrobium sp.]|nr:ATP-dependent helicase [Tepidimicrobium sp.]
MHLSDEQIQAISHFKGPALVLAVPGAGKTTVLIHRTANLILNKDISPEKILSITFSRASARDMKDRFNKLYGDISPIPVHFSTIHSFAYNLLREYAYKNRVRFRLIEDNSKNLNKYNILKSIYFSRNRQYIQDEDLEILINSFGYIKNMLITPEEFLSKNRINVENFLDIYNIYERYKRTRNLIDFDDMLTMSLEIFQNDNYLLNKYRNRYDFIQIDEGQDTSKVQMELIKMLSKPKNNLFIVADDDQSIYGFRGAYPKGLFEFKNIYQNIKLFYMEQNYRSSKNIVSVSNEFIKQNTLRYDKNIFTKNLYIEPVNIVKLKKPEDQYQYIVDNLITKRDYNNSAILYRNNISAIGVIEYLDRNRIPFHIRDVRVDFFNHWVLQDILDILFLARDPLNIDCFERIFYKTKGYISKRQIEYIKTLDKNISIFDRLLKLPGIDRSYRKSFLELQLDFKKLSNMNPHKGIRYIDDKLEYGKYLKECCMRFGYTLDSLRNILYLLKMIAAQTKTLSEFIERIEELEHVTHQSKKLKDGVNLSTIHSAKGLEFKDVYMIDLIEGDFPYTNSIADFNKGNIGPLEEERRLFYVGMTRAKERLNLITIKKMDSISLKPSRFLTELEELINQV